jgi:hypothetical protein
MLRKGSIPQGDQEHNLPTRSGSGKIKEIVKRQSVLAIPQKALGRPIETYIVQKEKKVAL